MFEEAEKPSPMRADVTGGASIPIMSEEEFISGCVVCGQLRSGVEFFIFDDLVVRREREKINKKTRKAQIPNKNKSEKIILQAQDGATGSGELIHACFIPFA